MRFLQKKKCIGDGDGFPFQRKCSRQERLPTCDFFQLVNTENSKRNELRFDKSVSRARTKTFFIIIFDKVMKRAMSAFRKCKSDVNRQCIAATLRASQRQLTLKQKANRSLIEFRFELARSLPSVCFRPCFFRNSNRIR